ncbi:hypothetical protein, partial [Tardiphaga sp.]|uniref:hypothetical protein n=1 Tax=Tardiphaga sp. TaxID=1926292 RepID=UPI00352B6078
LSSFELSFLLRATTAHALPGDDHLAKGAWGRGFALISQERFAVNPPAGAAGANPNLSLTSRYQTSFIAVV